MDSYIFQIESRFQGLWPALIALLVGCLCGGCSILLQPVERSSDAGSDAGEDVAVVDADDRHDADNDIDGDRDDEPVPDSEGDCEADCVDRECGPDGCGGSCGVCTPPDECDEEGRCECVCDGICCGDECIPGGECCSNDECAGCVGTPASCGELETQAPCRAQFDCTWNPSCVQPDNDTLYCVRYSGSEALCNDCGCIWEPGWPSYCRSTWGWPPLVPCQSLDARNCARCDCSDNSYCSGTASSCDHFGSAEACDGQQGCHWRRCRDHHCE